MSPKWYPYAVGALLALYIILLHTKTISFVTADLGRHLKNGELFISSGNILHTNFYSYTEPDFPVVTHHWGSGAIFYLIWKLSGFEGLTLWYAVASGISVFFIYDASRRISNVPFSAVSLLLAIPLIIYRIEIRPEVFSYLFFSLFVWLIILYRKKMLRFSTVSIIMLVSQLLWVNLHVLFILGFLVVGISGIEYVVRKQYHEGRRWGLLICGMTGVSLVNPFGIYGLLEPLTILRQYGYMIVENQSALFLIKRFGSGIYGYYFILAGLSISIITLSIISSKRFGGYGFFLYSIAMFAAALSFKYVRAFPLFGYMFSVCVPYAISLLVKKYPVSKERQAFIVAGFIGVIVWIGIGFNTVYSPLYANRFGVGLEEGVNASAEFFVKSNIRGPVFNNYDIGGYLIYHLYPEKVFVDNRPEAYSVSFFTETYIPAQESEEKWDELMAAYDFNVIYFYRHDMTPWAQPFLIRRIADPAWAAVYIDDWTIILVRDIPENRELIETYKIPPKVFSLSGGS